MPYFLTVIAFHLAKFICRPIQTISIFAIVPFLLIRLTKLVCVDSFGRSGVFVITLFLAVLPAILLSELLIGLGLLLRSSFLRPKPRFFRFGVFCWLHLGRGVVYWPVTSVAVLIDVSADESLYHGFCFGPNCFLDQNVLFINLLVFFIDPMSNRRPKALIKVLTQDAFCWSTPYVKFEQDGLYCFRWQAQSSISSCWYWESLLISLQMLFTKAVNSPRLFWRKALNSSYMRSATRSCSIWLLCSYKRNLILSQKNKAAKGTCLWPFASAVSKWITIMIRL